MAMIEKKCNAMRFRRYWIAVIVKVQNFYFFYRDLETNFRASVAINLTLDYNRRLKRELLTLFESFAGDITVEYDTLNDSRTISFFDKNEFTARTNMQNPAINADIVAIFQWY